jgi:hypothetical protein
MEESHMVAFLKPMKARLDRALMWMGLYPFTLDLLAAKIASLIWRIPGVRLTVILLLIIPAVLGFGTSYGLGWLIRTIRTKYGPGGPGVATRVQMLAQLPAAILAGIAFAHTEAH